VDSISCERGIRLQKVDSKTLLKVNAEEAGVEWDGVFVDYYIKCGFANDVLLCVLKILG
jgi:hypothetical protein